MLHIIIIHDIWSPNYLQVWCEGGRQGGCGGRGAWWAPPPSSSSPRRTCWGEPPSFSSSGHIPTQPSITTVKFMSRFHFLSESFLSASYVIVLRNALKKTISRISWEFFPYMAQETFQTWQKILFSESLPCFSELCWIGEWMMLEYLKFTFTELQT